MAMVEQKLVPTSDQTSNDDYAMSKFRLVRLIVQSSMGQKLVSIADNFLWVVEKCLEWSLPLQKTAIEENENLPTEYVRPLPWYLFLPSLIFIRTIKLMLNIGVRVIGFPRITTSTMLNIVQRSRRRLLAMKMSGQKSKEDSKDKRLSMHEARKALIRSIRLTLSTLSCLDTSKPSLSPPPTRIHVNSAFGLDTSLSFSPQTSTVKENSPLEVNTAQERSVSESTDSTLQNTLEDTSSDSGTSIEETSENVNEMLERLGDKSDDELDEDFDINDYMDLVSSEDSEDHSDDNISADEILALTNEAIQLKSTIAETNSDESNKQDINKAMKQDFNKAIKSEETEKQISKNEVEETVEQIFEKEICKEDKLQIADNKTMQTSEDATAQTSKEAIMQELEENLAQIPDKRLTSEGSHAKVDDLTSSRSLDSLECYTPDRSSQEGDLTFYSPISSDNDTSKEYSFTTIDKIVKTNQFINGEIRSETMISESKASEETNNNGAVIEKRSTNVSKIHKSKRTSHGNRKKK